MAEFSGKDENQPPAISSPKVLQQANSYSTGWLTTRKSKRKEPRYYHHNNFRVILLSVRLKMLIIIYNVNPPYLPSIILLYLYLFIRLSYTGIVDRWSDDDTTVQPEVERQTKRTKQVL